MKKKFLILFLLISVAIYGNNQEKNESLISNAKSISKASDYNFMKIFDAELLENYFGSYEKASFVVSDGKNIIIYNDKLSNKPISPYSTFKIPNTIIALELGIISEDNSLKKWDGTKYSRKVLNQDHDLASAIDNSVVWYYKEIAREIGKNNMKKYLEIMSYGNKDISGGVDKFWLGSSLKITPIEQVKFLIKLYNNEFNFKENNIEILKKIIKQNNLDYDIYGKSGSSGKGMSWFVGYVIKEDKPYFFATYLEDKEKGLEAKGHTIEMFSEIIK